MRIGLLTLPLAGNFGGMLQAAALFRVLEDLGHTVVFVDIAARKQSRKQLAAGLLARIPFQNFRGLRARHRSMLTHLPFLRRYLPRRTARLFGCDELGKEVARLALDAIVVGSDQVWRFEYQGENQGLAYFLDFGPTSLIRLSYGASFGHGSWAYPERTGSVAALLARFRAVSVREASGVKICRDALGRADAELVCDPTLLVERTFLEGIASGCRGQRGVLVYALDDHANGAEIVRIAASTVGKGQSVRKISVQSPELTVPDWIAAFRDADFVITDSFHGTVLSLIFEKPFLTIANRARGLDRFTTLLGQVGLQDRLIFDEGSHLVAEIVQNKIDFTQVRAKITEFRRHSRAFLERTLS